MVAAAVGVAVTLFEPEHPCRVMETRPCPTDYAGTCGDRPCARFESDDPTPWAVDVAAWRAEYARERAG